VDRHGLERVADVPGVGRSVDQFTGPRDRVPDVRFTLTAAQGTVRLASGRRVGALTFNGRSPGPELRVPRGALVEVTLINKDVHEGVTLHWHGIDVPNAEDGVPGVTQDAVRPGGRHVYRFVPDRTGTYWYHTHQSSDRAVERGLFGALIVEDGHRGYERTVFTHLWPGEIGAFGTADVPERLAVTAGEPVRLRLVNSSREPQRLLLGGAPYQVAAVDGNPVNNPGALAPGTDLLLAAGGRYDVTFAMPAGPVTLRLDTAEIPNTAALVLSPDGQAVPAHLTPGRLFDRLAYGEPEGGGPPAGPYRREFELVLDNGFGFAGGGFTFADTINGRLAPGVPTLMVAEGDRVRMRITARGIIDHPMHLHGHRVRVLSRNGVPVTGSAWWTDTLNVAPGESYELDFTADNPGVWMDHCHNFEHAEGGMIMHLAYEGVTSPYHAGHTGRNR
jgi:FtsP/CotA-like multicopper oxidase with cupredoxin domain